MDVRSPRASTRAVSFDAVLSRAASALNSTLDLPAVLHTLAEATLQISAARRATLFVEQDGRFDPAVSLGPHADPDLWQAFRDMPAVELDADQRALLADGTPVAIPDAARSPVLPASWVHRFDVQSAVVSLLHAHGRPCGLLVADYQRCRAFSDDEVARLAGISALAGLAIDQARSRTRATQAREQAAERQRVTDELHANVARLLAVMHRRAGAMADQAPPDHPWRRRAAELARLADGGAFQFEQAARLLQHWPDEERDLPVALRELGEDVAAASGMDVLVEVDGEEPDGAHPPVDRALYRVAWEALTGAWRHGRCDVVRVHLHRSPWQVELTVVDDGASPAARHDRPVTGQDLLAIRRELAGIEGSLHVTEIRPHGQRLQVVAPLTAG